MMVTASVDVQKPVKLLRLLLLSRCAGWFLSKLNVCSSFQWDLKRKRVTYFLRFRRQ